jgi:hypothetical protein
LLRNPLATADKSPEPVEEDEVPDALREEAVELPRVVLVVSLSLELPELEEGLEAEDEEEALQARFFLFEERVLSLEPTCPPCCTDL